MPGSLQPLGGNRYRVRIYVGINPVTGRQRARSRTFTFEGDDKVKLRHVRDSHAQELRDEAIEAAAAKGTIAELAKDWIALKRQQGRAPSTIDGYMTVVDRIVARFGKMRVVDLTGRDIDRWYGELLAKKKPVMTAATVNHHHAILRAMLRQAEKWGDVEHVATRRSSPPAGAASDINPPSTAEVTKLISAAGAGDFAMSVRILAGTGIRRGELIGLWWSDIAGDMLTVRRSVTERTGEPLHIGPTKGRRKRTFSVGRDVVRAIQGQRALLEAKAAAIGLKLPKDGPMFASLEADPSGRTPRQPSWLSHRWDELRDLLGMDYRLHDLRHWNATTLLALGVPITTVSERLGHAQVSTTLNIYGHGVPRADRDAARQMADALGIKPRAGWRAADRSSPTGPASVRVTRRRVPAPAS